MSAATWGAEAKLCNNAQLPQPTLVRHVLQRLQPAPQLGGVGDAQRILVRVLHPLQHLQQAASKRQGREVLSRQMRGRRRAMRALHREVLDMAGQPKYQRRRLQTNQANRQAPPARQRHSAAQGLALPPRHLQTCTGLATPQQRHPPQTSPILARSPAHLLQAGHAVEVALHVGAQLLRGGQAGKLVEDARLAGLLPRRDHQRVLPPHLGRGEGRRRLGRGQAHGARSWPTSQARPGQARPGQARPGQARPGQARPQPGLTCGCGGTSCPSCAAVARASSHAARTSWSTLACFSPGSITWYLLLVLMYLQRKGRHRRLAGVGGEPDKRGELRCGVQLELGPGGGGVG
jgi:hypothetical protein